MRVSVKASSRAGAQHASLALLKEMLATLDVAQRTGTPADRKAADRLQRRQEPCMASYACLSEPQRGAACMSSGDRREPAPSLRGPPEVGPARVGGSPCHPAGAQRLRVCLGREPHHVPRLRQAAARRPEGERLPAGAGAPDQGLQPQAAAAVARGRPRRDAAPRPAPAGAAVAPGCAARMLAALHRRTPCVPLTQVQRHPLACGRDCRPAVDFQPMHDALRSLRSRLPIVRTQRQANSW